MLTARQARIAYAIGQSKAQTIHKTNNSAVDSAVSKAQSGTISPSDVRPILADKTAFTVLQRLIGKIDLKGKSSAEQRESVRNAIIKYGEDRSDGVHIRDGSKRTDGENTEGQAPAVERGTGKADSGADSRAKGIARKDQGKAGEEVVYGGVKQKGVYYAKTDTAEMKSGREIAKNHGYDIVYFAGGNIETDGVAFRASIDTDSHTVTVRADHPDYSVDQLLRHELMHETINSGDADLSEIRSKLLESLSEPEP